MTRKIDDEMIARYLANKTTKEEEERVMEYVGESDENMEDFFYMAAAIENHKQRVKIESQRRVWRRRMTMAASVLVAVGMGVAIFYKANKTAKVGIENSPTYGVEDSIMTDNEMEEEAIWLLEQ